MLSRSLETLSLRMEKAAQSASQVPAWLAANAINPCKVLHLEHCVDPMEAATFATQCTGPGSTFSFVIEDDSALALRILYELSIFKLAVSLGGTESLACHLASTTHSGVPLERRRAVGITDGLIWLSIGLEHPDDLIEDLKQAFARAVRREHPTPRSVFV